jgi:hypothetical protein
MNLMLHALSVQTGVNLFSNDVCSLSWDLCNVLQERSTAAVLRNELSER